MTISKNSRNTLAKKLNGAFGSATRPDSFFDVSKDYRHHYVNDFSDLEEMDWQTAEPADFKNIYESSTFISAEAFRYLIPHVFNYCVRWRDEAIPIDFISVFLDLARVSDRIQMFVGYTKQDKELVWEFLTFIDDELGFDFIDREDGYEKTGWHQLCKSLTGA